MCVLIATSLQPPLKCSLVILLWHRRCVEIGQQCGFVIVTVLIWGTVQPVFVHAETRIIPSVALSERYNSNVFFAPPGTLAPGTRNRDFISTVAGGVQLLHRTRDVEASFTGGADYNRFVYNTDLHYVSTTANADARLDGWVGRLAEGARLSISERFRYTPEPPGFLAGAKSQTGGDNPFARGTQGFRANSYSNTVSANGSYPVFRELSLQGSYSYSLFHVASSVPGTTPGATASFFNTKVNTWSVGPSLDLSTEEQIGLFFKQSFYNQTSAANSGPSFSFNTQEGYANYTRKMQGWSVSLRGGATYLEPSSLVFPSGAVSFSTNPERSTYVQLDLSRQAAPSTFFVSGATISNVGQVSITHQLSDRLKLGGNANYSQSETVPIRSSKFQNITVSVGFNYMLTRTMAVDLSYSYTKFTIDQPGILHEVLRDLVAIQLTEQWN